MLKRIKLKGTDWFLKFLNEMSSSPEIGVPSYDKWASLGELLTSENSVSADMIFTLEVQMCCTYIT